MRTQNLAGRIQTVLGVIDADALGVTLPHEHLLIDMAAWFQDVSEASEKKMAKEPLKLENLWWIKTHSYNSLDNLKLQDEELAIKEALMYKNAGGNTIVDLTNIGMARNPLALARISRATGLNIIMGSGYYIGASHPSELVDMAEQEITEGIIRDIVEGVDNTGIHAGIIGEIGCSEPLYGTERKVLRAAAAAQRLTGAPLNIHPSTNDDLVLEIVDILKKAGADLTHTIINHIDQWGFRDDTCRRLADAGCFIEFDSFGNEGIYLNHQDNTLTQYAQDDVILVKRIAELISEGYIEQILISCDVCLKQLLVTYGGYGYAHIMRAIVPVMRWSGLSDKQINTLLVDNPKRAFAFVEPEE